MTPKHEPGEAATELDPECGPGLALRVHTAPRGLLDGAYGRARAPRPRTRVVWGTGFAVGALCAAGLVLGLAERAPPAPYAALGGPTSGVEAAPVVLVGDPLVPVRFVFSAPAARAVTVAGTWNEWSPTAAPLHRADDGTFWLEARLPRGQHEYLFVIDGERWVSDPASPLTRDDGFGQQNSVLIL
jgi:hypothetical protein